VKYCYSCKNSIGVMVLMWWCVWWCVEYCTHVRVVPFYLKKGIVPFYLKKGRSTSTLDGASIRKQGRSTGTL
jgi:hypothetical protein